MSKFCIYHGNCADGFTGAWVVRRAMGPATDFHAGTYGEPPPDVKGREVVLVDFSYKRAAMERIVAEAKSVLVMDHHKTAEEDLRGLAGAIVEFDMDRAGCRIAWDHYFPGEPPPDLLRHVEDRDLWRFALPRTREIQANVFSHPYDFRAWDRLMCADVRELARDGEAIERKHRKDVAELVKAGSRMMRIGGCVVPAANLPGMFSSDAGHMMAEGHPFAACYYDTPRGRSFSLRSRDGGADVSEVAKAYGGGGHRNAAGFTVPLADAGQFEI